MRPSRPRARSGLPAALRRWLSRSTIVLLSAPGLGADDVRSAEEHAVAELIARAEVFISQQQRRADRAWPFATEALRRAEALGDAALESRAATVTGKALLQMDRMDESLSMLERGATAARVAGDPLLETEALRWKGNVLAGRAAFDEAQVVLEAALTAATTGGSVVAEVNALNSLGVNARHRGAAREYLSLARRALALLDSEREAGRAVPDTLAFSVPFNVGRALSMAGDFAAAGQLFARAFDSAHATGHRGGQWHALHETGEWYAGQGDARRARRYFERAHAVSLGMDARDMEASSLHGIAVATAALGDLREARQLFEEACALYEKVDYRSFLPRCRAEQARVLRRLGELPAARALVEAALAASRTAEHHTGVALCLLEQGRIALAEARPDTAVTSFARVVDLARMHGLRALEVPGLVGLARAESARGRSERASELLQDAIAAIQGIRSRIPSPDLRAAFDEARKDAFGLLFRQLVALHRADPAAGFAAEALLLLERQRGLSLAEAVLRSGGVRRRGLAAPVGEALSHAEHRVASLQLRLAEERATGSQRRELLAQLDDAERSLHVLEAAATPASWQPPDKVSRFQRSLEPGEAAIVYPADDTPLAFVVTKDAVTAVPLRALADLEARLSLFVRLLLSRDPERAVPVGRALADAVLSPALGVLPQSVSRLVVVASGPLALAPLGVLPDPVAPDRPLLARLPVSYMPSLTLLDHLRSAVSAPGTGLLAVAAPGRRVPDAVIPGGHQLPPLPRAVAEVRRVGAYAPQATLLVGLDANEERFRHLPLADYGIIHFATHALLDPGVPERSAIVLVARGHDDGLLQPREIYDLDVGAGLVVLNACGSASGQVSAADGMRSLARAFLHAGAHSVLGTQWRVGDVAAERLARRFYDELSTGHAVARALARAQSAVAGPRPWANAPEWAGYVLVGDPAVRPLPPGARARSPLMTWRLAAVLAAALAVGLGVGLYVRRRA